MEPNKCFRENCDLEVEYVCFCTSPATYSCNTHWTSHCQLKGRVHQFESLLPAYFQETKKAVLKFLTKEKLRNDKLKKKALINFNRSLSDSENSFKAFLKNVDSDLIEINNNFEKVQQYEKISNSGPDPFLDLLLLIPDEAVKKAKEITIASSESYKSEDLVWGLSRDIEKMVDSFINDRFKIFVDRLIELNKLIEEFSANKNRDNRKLAEIKSYVTDLLRNTEKSVNELEEWRQELKKRYQKHSHVRGQNSATENFSTNLSETQIQIKNKSIIQGLTDKKSMILSRVNNQNIEREFRNTCSLYEYEKIASDTNSPYNKAYQEYTRAYSKISSLYLTRDDSKTTSLFVYNTETEKEENRLLESVKLLNAGTCTTLLPDGNLFCFGKSNPVSGIVVIINEFCETQLLPSGVPCYNSSAVYFNRSVYCFGGTNDNDLNLSERFDLDKKRWIKLLPLPEPDSYCHSIALNGDILISGYKNPNLLKYSIDKDSFVRIPTNFAANKNKIIMNLDRLYLIECGGVIYESETGNETIWRQVANSIISCGNPLQVYSSYNKGAIYIGSNCLGQNCYYKFDLNQEIMIKL